MYRLRTFGGLAIERKNGATPGQIEVHRKSLALLAVIAVHNGVGRERVAALLWPESDEDRAKGSLNQAVHLLRRLLEAPDLLLGTAELRLNPERIESDANLFYRALEEGNAAAAVEQYGGPFLDGVSVNGAPDFERWVEGRRAELERRYLDALEQLALTAEARGEHEAAVQWWQRLQASDPPNSRVAVRLMLALDASGNRAAALRHAQIHDTLLREEWGIPPDSTVTELAERLRSAENPPYSSRDTSALPAYSASSQQGIARVDDRRPAAGDQLVSPSAETKPVPRRSFLRRWTLVAMLAIVGLGAALASLIGPRARTDFDLLERPVPRSSFNSALDTPAPEFSSIAVLPFIDLSPERDQEYFSDGMAEELTAALARIDGLQVAARTSAFQFKGRSPDVSEVREKLRVAHLLEGSVRKSGDRLRVTAQLVSTENGYHLWSETYERRLSDVFTVQEGISRAIVEALQVRLGAGTGMSLVAAPTGDIDAYELYLKGLYFLNRLQIPQSVEHLTQAARRDPQFARAYSALAEAYAVPAAYSDLSPVDSRRLGLAAADSALRIDPLLADAHAALGWLEMVGLRWEEAGRGLRRAIEIDPRSPRARLYYALFLHRQGRLEDAFGQLRLAREMDPLSLPVNALYGSLLGDLGHPDEALAHLEATLELDPSFPITHAVMGHIYMGTGRIGDAIRHYERVAEIVPTSFYIGFLGHAYGRAGRILDARLLLSELMARTDRGEHVSAGAVGWIHLGLDERDEGFGQLDLAANQRDVFLTVYGVLSNRYLADPYRDDPRFQQLRTKVGLPMLHVNGS